MKSITRLVCLVGLTISALTCFAQAVPKCPDRESGKTTVSASPITIDNTACSGLHGTFNYEVTGSPATLSVTLQGCMRAPSTAPCSLLDTYSATASVNRKPSIDSAYDYFLVTPTWTGGTGVTFTVNSTITIASGGSGGGVTITTVSGLASIPGLQNGTIAVVTNGASGTDCTTGGGTTDVACQYNGTTWGQLAAASSGATAFSAITGATNLNALLMGSGGSLGPTGTGIIKATDTVSSAAFAPTADGKFGVNTTNHSPVFGSNGATITWPQNNAGTTNQFFTAYNWLTGAFTTAQPSFGNLSGSATATQLPAALANSTSVNSTTIPASVVWPVTNAATLHNFLTGFTQSTGAFTSAQPSTADLSDVANIILKNQANTYSTGLQSMAAADLLLPVHSTDPATCTAGQIEFNSTGVASKVCTSTNTWTALGGAVDVPQMYLPAASPNEELIVPNAQTGSGANSVSCVQFIPARGITATKMSIAVNTASVGQSVNIGIYDNSLNLVRDSGSFSCGTGGSVALSNTVSSFRINANSTYYACAAFTDTTCAIQGSGGSLGMSNISNKNATREFTCANALSAGAMPATCGTQNATSNLKRYFSLLEQ